jgi:hypothetical protein
MVGVEIMKHYKDSNNNVFGIESGKAPSGMVEVSIEEVLVINLAKRSPEQVLKQEAAKEKAERKSAMLTGEDYRGYTISFTSEDGNGLVQVKSSFELGLTETNIHFENGTVMPITSEDFPEFALWFIEKRNSFF